MSILGDFFKNEMNGESFSQALQAGELRQVTVNRQERSAVLVVDFPRFVEYGELKKLEALLEGPTFGLPSVRLHPHFPAEGLLHTARYIRGGDV